MLQASGARLHHHDDQRQESAEERSGVPPGEPDQHQQGTDGHAVEPIQLDAVVGGRGDQVRTEERQRPLEAGVVLLRAGGPSTRGEVEDQPRDLVEEGRLKDFALGLQPLQGEDRGLGTHDPALDDDHCETFLEPFRLRASIWGQWLGGNPQTGLR